MLRQIAIAVFLGAALAGSQTTQLVLEQQVRLSAKQVPGTVISFSVGEDGQSLKAAPQAARGWWIIADPDNPGCVPQAATPGAFKFPVAPLAVRVILNGQILSVKGEYTWSRDTVTIPRWSPGSAVMCDYKPIEGQ